MSTSEEDLSNVAPGYVLRCCTVYGNPFPPSLGITISVGRTAKKALPPTLVEWLKVSGDTRMCTIFEILTDGYGARRLGLQQGDILLAKQEKGFTLGETDQVKKAMANKRIFIVYFLRNTNNEVPTALPRGQPTTVSRSVTPHYPGKRASPAERDTENNGEDNDGLYPPSPKRLRLGNDHNNDSNRNDDSTTKEPADNPQVQVPSQETNDPETDDLASPVDQTTSNKNKTPSKPSIETTTTITTTSPTEQNKSEPVPKDEAEDISSVEDENGSEDSPRETSVSQQQDTYRSIVKENRRRQKKRLLKMDQLSPDEDKTQDQGKNRKEFETEQRLALSGTLVDSNTESEKSGPEHAPENSPTTLPKEGLSNEKETVESPGKEDSPVTDPPETELSVEQMLRRMLAEDQFLEGSVDAFMDVLAEFCTDKTRLQAYFYEFGLRDIVSFLQKPMKKFHIVGWYLVNSVLRLEILDKNMMSQVLVKRDVCNLMIKSLTEETESTVIEFALMTCLRLCLECPVYKESFVSTTGSLPGLYRAVLTSSITVELLDMLAKLCSQDMTGSNLVLEHFASQAGAIPELLSKAKEYAANVPDENRETSLGTYLYLVYRIGSTSTDSIKRDAVAAGALTHLGNLIWMLPDSSQLQESVQKVFQVLTISK